MPVADLPLTGRTIAVTAERKRQEQADLFTKRGAAVVVATTMHTVDLTDDDELRRRTEAVIADPPDRTVATTGFGMRLWFETADAWGIGDALTDALRVSTVVARGPKAQSACRQRGLEVAWRAERESMDEVLAWLRDQRGIGDDRLVVQLFDPEGHPSTDALAEITGDLVQIPLYRWRLPADTGPARDLIQRIVGRELDAVTFTSQPAVRFLFDLAAAEGLVDEVRAAFESGEVLQVCIGPVCAEALVDAGVTTGIWPEPFRLVPMVKLATDRLVAET